MSSENLEAKLEALEKRVQMQEDIQAILRVQYAYGYYVKRWQADEIVKLFSNDPETTVIIGDSGKVKGKEAIVKYYNHFNNPPAEFMHMTMTVTPIITVDDNGGHAKARLYSFGLLGTPGTPEKGRGALWSTGEFENEYIKEDGVWKFFKVHYNRIFMTPYSEGWAKVTDYKGGARANEPKPQDPDIVYAPYPSTYIFPYHYKNPVAGD